MKLAEGKIMRRREFIGLLGMAALDGSRAAIAQTSARVYHLGTISPGAPILDTSSNGKILIDTLAQHGFTLGQNLKIEARGAMGEFPFEETAG